MCGPCIIPGIIILFIIVSTALFSIGSYFGIIDEKSANYYNPCPSCVSNILPSSFLAVKNK